jgi:hypothetical protein
MFTKAVQAIGRWVSESKAEKLQATHMTASTNMSRRLMQDIAWYED